MKLIKVLVTPLINIKELLLSIHSDAIPDIANIRELLFDSFISIVIDNIYKEIYSEPEEITEQDIKDVYDDILFPNEFNRFNFDDYNINPKVIIDELYSIKNQLIYLIAMEGSLTSVVFHTHIVSSSVVKILIYDISPITKLRKIV